MRSALAKHALLLSILLPALALADPPDAESAAELAQAQTWQSQVAQRLVERGSADTLATAAVMLPISMTMYDNAVSKQERQSASHKNSAARLQLLDRAAAAAPDAPDIAALALQVCTSVPGCDVGSHAERLHRTAPDDAAYLLPALGDAQSRQDRDKVSAILQAMADATTFNTWYPATRKRLQRGIDAIVVPALPTPAPADFLRKHPDMGSAALAANMAGAMMFGTAGMPDYGSIDKACQKDAAEFLSRQEACRQIGLLLSRDKSVMARSVGLAFWRNAAHDKADLAAAKNATRKLDWQQQSSSELMMDGTIDPFESFQATLDQNGETPGMITLLKKHGISTQPPAGWVSRREKWRQKSQARQEQEPAPKSGVCPGTP